jgi:hypothetical protein
MLCHRPRNPQIIRYNTGSVSLRYEIRHGKAELLSANALKEAFPKGWAYLAEHREALAGREHGKMRHVRWYAYVYPKNPVKFAALKLIVQVTAQRPTALYDERGRMMPPNGARCRCNSSPAVSVASELVIAPATFNTCA